MTIGSFKFASTGAAASNCKAKIKDLILIRNKTRLTLKNLILGKREILLSTKPESKNGLFHVIHTKTWVNHSTRTFLTFHQKTFQTKSVKLDKNHNVILELTSLFLIG